MRHDPQELPYPPTVEEQLDDLLRLGDRLTKIGRTLRELREARGRIAEGIEVTMEAQYTRQGYGVTHLPTIEGLSPLVYTNALDDRISKVTSEWGKALRELREWKAE